MLILFEIGFLKKKTKAEPKIVITRAKDIPIIMYNVPGRTGCNIQPQTAVTLAKTCKNIVAIKEASGNISQICKMAMHIGDNFNIYSGNDDQTVPILSLGGMGCISTVSNIIPARYSLMIHDFLDGKVTDAGLEQVALKPLIDVIFSEVNPIPIKAALSLMGKCGLEYRLPLCPPSSKTQFALYDELRNYGIL